MHHNEWFIENLLLHIKIPLTQQKVTTKFEGLEIAMRLKSTPVGVENSTTMVQVQSQLAELTLQL